MIMMIGHRGAPALAPENTLESFEKAIEAGCTGIEFDVRRCRSKGEIEQLVVIHDSKVDRTTDGEGRVKKLSIDDLRELKTENGEVVPTLEEAMLFIGKQAKMFVEIKSRPITIATAKFIQQEIRNHVLSYDGIVIIAFYPDILKKVREFDPKFSIGATIEFVNEDQQGVLAGKDSFLYRESHQDEDLENILTGLALDHINPDIKCLTKEMVDAAHAKNIQVNTWTVNSVEDAEKAIACGVDSIMTDDPNMLKQVLESI